jgi:hypothetical protein
MLIYTIVSIMLNTPMTSPYYQPSGRVSPRVVQRLLIATLVLLPAAWVYAWAMLHFYAFFKIFPPIFFYLCLGAACTSVCEKGQVRNPVVMVGLALAMCLLVWYCHWVFWAAMAGPDTGPGVLTLLGDPASVWMQATAAPRRGVAVVVSAGCELILLVALPAWMSRMAAREPFCESAQTWPQETKLERRFGGIAHLAHFTSALEATPNQVLSCMPVFTDAAHHTTLGVHQCAGEAYVTIREVKETVDNGASSVVITEVVKQLRVSAVVGKQVALACAKDSALAVAQIAEDEDGDLVPLDDLKPALDALRDGHFAEALAAALPYAEAAEVRTRSDALRVCAISCSSQARWHDAAAYWERLFACEASGHNALQVATSKVMAGELADGEEWVEQAKKLSAASADVGAFLIHTNFITALKQNGYLRAAMPYLDWVKQGYETLHSTDATFLTMQDVPFFEVFLEQSETIVDASMDRAQAHAWYASMLPHIDQGGQALLEAWLGRRSRKAGQR